MKKFSIFTGLMAAFLAAIVLMGATSVFAQDIVEPAPGTESGGDDVVGQEGGEAHPCGAEDEICRQHVNAMPAGFNVDNVEHHGQTARDHEPEDVVDRECVYRDDHAVYGRGY